MRVGMDDAEHPAGRADPKTGRSVPGAHLALDDPAGRRGRLMRRMALGRAGGHRENSANLFPPHRHHFP